MSFQIVVCGTLVPDPLQTLEPVTVSGQPALKNEMMLPAVLDPWAAHALYEAANLARQLVGSPVGGVPGSLPSPAGDPAGSPLGDPGANRGNPGSPGSGSSSPLGSPGATKVWLVSLGPKAKLQQVMMTVAQKVPFELVALDGPASGFCDSFATAAALAEAIGAIPGLDRSRLLLFCGWESASRGAGTTLQMVGERLGITEQFLGVDRLSVLPDGSMEILERVEGGEHQVSILAGPPAVLGWATGYLPEPRNNPQVGMANMRLVMPALQRAKAAAVSSAGLCFQSVSLPAQRRDTRIVKNMPAEEIAQEIVAWIKEA